MKNLIALLVVVFFATAGFAQETEKASAVKAQPATMQAQPSTMQKDMKMKSHEDYEMKDGKLMHCTGDKSTPVTSNITLKNGMMIDRKSTRLNSSHLKLSRMPSSA